MTNEASNLIFSGSRNWTIAVPIVWGYCFPGWRPIWPPKHKNGYISAHWLGFTAILAAILKSNIPKLLPLRSFDSLTLRVLHSTTHLSLYHISELSYTHFCVLEATLAAILDSTISTLLPLQYFDSLTLKILHSEDQDQDFKKSQIADTGYSEALRTKLLLAWRSDWSQVEIQKDWAGRQSDGHVEWRLELMPATAARVVRGRG